MEKRSFSELTEDINEFLSEMSCDSLAELYEQLSGNKKCEFNSEEETFEITEK